MTLSLIDKKLLFLDGGLGTTLEDEHGVKFSAKTPLWSSHLLISDPNILKTAQKNFANAGADIILTPTYQASRKGFQQSTGATESVAHYAALAVQISRNASHGLVALSLGAFGAILQPSQEYSGEYGNMTEDDLVTFHADRLADFYPNFSDIDLVAFETLPRLDEIRAVKRAYTSTKPYWISCVFPTTSCLPDGSTVDQLLPAMLASPAPWAIGLNCTKLDKVGKIIEEFEAVAGKLGLQLPRLVLYPDGTDALVYDTTLQQWIGEEGDSSQWDQELSDLVCDAWSRNNWSGIVVGGCCKTTPKHISRLRERVESSLTNA